MLLTLTGNWYRHTLAWMAKKTFAQRMLWLIPVLIIASIVGIGTAIADIFYGIYILFLLMLFILLFQIKLNIYVYNFY